MFRTRSAAILRAWPSGFWTLSHKPLSDGLPPPGCRPVRQPRQNCIVPRRNLFVSAPPSSPFSDFTLFFTFRPTVADAPWSPGWCFRTRNAHQPPEAPVADDCRRQSSMAKMERERQWYGRILCKGEGHGDESGSAEPGHAHQ